MNHLVRITKSRGMWRWELVTLTDGMFVNTVEAVGAARTFLGAALEVDRELAIRGESDSRASASQSTIPCQFDVDGRCEWHVHGHAAPGTSPALIPDQE